MARRFSYAEKGKALSIPPRPPQPPRVKVPAFDNIELLRRHALTIIGRLTNPAIQKVWSLIPFLADHWKLSSRPVGADLGNGLFQFQFANELDLLKALENQPYHFSQWMVILQRWEPTIDKSFPSQIPFWIHVQGIPVHLWSEEILSSIAESIGHFVKAEITPTYFRMRVEMNGLQPLIKKTLVELYDGSVLEATLVYDKLGKHCNFCYKLDHEESDCHLLKHNKLSSTHHNNEPRHRDGRKEEGPPRRDEIRDKSYRAAPRDREHRQDQHNLKGTSAEDDRRDSDPYHYRRVNASRPPSKGYSRESDHYRRSSSSSFHRDSQSQTGHREIS